MLHSVAAICGATMILLWLHPSPGSMPGSQRSSGLYLPFIYHPNPSNILIFVSEANLELSITFFLEEGFKIKQVFNT